MPRVLRRRPSPALIVAIIALVIACAGTATAAGVLIKRSSQVARGAINSGDLANDRAVNLQDLTPAARLALQNDAGPTGPQGERGVQGPAGAKGDRGPRGEDGARGPSGENGSAIAYAYVTGGGASPAALQKGVVDTTVRLSSNNFAMYCFKLAVPVSNAVATLDYGDLQRNATAGAGFDEHVYPLLPYSPGAEDELNRCPDGYRDAAAVVVTTTGRLVAFWVSFN
jgi:hypothetical protein